MAERSDLMREFFLEHYPQLSEYLTTPQGQVALDQVGAAWAAGFTDKGSLNDPRGVVDFCRNLVEQYVQMATDAFVSSKLPMDEWEERWVHTHASQLQRAFEVGAAYMDWVCQSVYIDPSEATVLTTTEAQRNALAEWGEGMGRDLGGVILDLGESARDTVISSLRQSKQAYLNPLDPINRTLLAESRIALVVLRGAAAVFLYGFVLGLIPGLLLGLVGWHRIGSVAVALVWGLIYLRMKSSMSDLPSGLRLVVAVSTASGLGASVYLLGGIVS